MPLNWQKTPNTRSKRSHKNVVAMGKRSCTGHAWDLRCCLACHLQTACSGNRKTSEFPLQGNWAWGSSGFIFAFFRFVFCSMSYNQSLSWELPGGAGKGHTVKHVAWSGKGVLQKPFCGGTISGVNSWQKLIRLIYYLSGKKSWQVVCQNVSF